MNNEVFNKLMYMFTKDAAKYSFSDFLEDAEVTEEEWEEIKIYLKEKFGTITYV